MHPTAHRSPPLVLHPAFLLGSLIALYFLLGRWTFARLQGDFDKLPVFEQPRVWVISAIAVVAAVIYCALRDRGLSQFHGIDLAIVSWLTYMLASSLWSPDVTLATEKALDVIMLIVVALSIAMTRSSATEGKALLGFWYAVVAIGAAMGLLALYASSHGRTFTPTGGPNIFGRNMGLVGLGSLLIASRSAFWEKMPLYVIVVLSAMWVLMSGSRGALLASVMAALVLVLMARARMTTKVFSVLALGTVGIAFLVNSSSGQTALEVFQHRILHQTVEQRYTASRDTLFVTAMELGTKWPIAGSGLNGFRANSWTYPHNLFLETFAEGGTIGLSLLLLVFGIWWRTLRRDRRAMTGITLAAMTLLVTSASFSGDIYDSRGVFLFLALSADPLQMSSPIDQRTATVAGVGPHKRPIRPAYKSLPDLASRC